MRYIQKNKETTKFKFKLDYLCWIQLIQNKTTPF